MTFDTVIILDWSGGNQTGPTPRKDAIWAAIGRGGITENPQYFRNRQQAEAWLIDTLDAEQAAGRKTAVGIDICFAFPGDLTKRLTGTTDPLALWDWLAARVKDTPTQNNRFDLAAEINRQFDGIGPFWGNGLARDIADLPRKGRARTTTQPEKRRADAAAKGAFSPWQLSGAGAVGSQVIMALPMLSRLRKRFAPDINVWPFQPADAQITLVEVYLTLLKDALKREGHPIRDAAQVALFARVLSGLPAAEWHRLLDHPRDPEGWVLGLGHEDMLTRAATQNPILQNDCFALPQGVTWTPVDTALDHLQRNLSCVTGIETLPISQASGRRLAQDITARRAHPPAPNSAVDGYAFAGGLSDEPAIFPLVTGRAAAGAAYPHPVPQGHAIRILTGAILPQGVDTVVLQEDTTATADTLHVTGPLKQGANARAAGEDMVSGQTILTAPRTLTPADIGTAIAAGVAKVRVHIPLRVGVLSTGDELRTPGQTAAPDQIYDANRPMLLATVSGWGHTAIDLGIAPDDRDVLRGMLDAAAPQCDVILTSGGASAGDEDHMSALLRDTGSFALWRIAVKPGRPLALGLWQGTPVFGLPGNPVAAQVCALVFAAPALSLLAGGGWLAPAGLTLPAGFSKSKKAGRREYLRARITDGGVEIFPSEGSGRVSGLSWAAGLVALPDAACVIKPGDPVQYFPFADFGT